MLNIKKISLLLITTLGHRHQDRKKKQTTENQTNVTNLATDFPYFHVPP